MSAVTRDALIEAGTEAIRRKWDLPYRSIDPHVTDDVRKVLDAVLPMLADAVHELPLGNGHGWEFAGATIRYRAAALIRSLAGPS